MEQNNIEMLDEVEMDLVVEEPKAKPLAEYEKLLLAEAAREDFEKAVNLVKFGCFEQKEETTLDFSNLELIKTEKKYKGLYSLYRNLDNMQLMLVCPLVENNKGDKDERTDLAPYAYDVIYVETMDNETYQMVCKAANNNIRNFTGVLYKTTLALWIAMIALTSVYLIIAVIRWVDWARANSSLLAIIQTILDYIGTYVIGVVISTPLVLISRILYLKNRDQK